MIMEQPNAELTTPKPRFSKRVVAFALAALVVCAAPMAALATRGKLVERIASIVALHTPLAGESEGRTNILIMGMTLDGHRTDSLILASYYYKEKKLVTLNIPRDLYFNGAYGSDKLGSLFAHAQTLRPRDPAFPPTEVAAFLSKEYGIPIHYWIEVNMDGFKRVVDTVGGVDVVVQRPFVDELYPKDDYSGYVRPAPSFAAGPQHMDGARALVFARSRHSQTFAEGTDFARSQRQSLVIQAVLKKIDERGLLNDILDVKTFYGIFKDDVSTNVQSGELRLADIARHLDPQTQYVRANWSNSVGFLCDATTSYGAQIILYGVPGDCGIAAGEAGDSRYRERAIAFVRDLLYSAEAQTITQTSYKKSAADPS